LLIPAWSCPSWENMSDYGSSDESDFLPSVLKRPKVANHIAHESFTVDTRDHEDHTFCGIMFDVRCRAREEGGAPLEFMEINAISVRGLLGPLTVWTTPDSFNSKEDDKELWELIYEAEHSPSHRDYQQLELTRPVRLCPGGSSGLYVHSKLPGDSALVYDNQRNELTYEDEVLQVYPGLAHLSNRPFGRRGMWGFPWRDNREFVGRVHYGVGYMLWNPEVHHYFPIDFRKAVKACLLCARRPESPLSRLQDDVVFYILNMCKYDWFSQGPRSRGGAGCASREGFRGINSAPMFNRVPGRLAGRTRRFPSGIPVHMLPRRSARGRESPDIASDSDDESSHVAVQRGYSSGASHSNNS